MSTIKCDKCGVVGTARIQELGDPYYKDFCSEGEPIYLSRIDGSGQLCTACIKKMGDGYSKTFLEKPQFGRG